MLKNTRAAFACFAALLLMLTACGDDSTDATSTHDSGEAPQQDADLLDTGPSDCPQSCGDPPGSTCIAPDRVRTFAPQGHCEEGQCTYPHVDRPCPEGCEAGACLGDLCQGLRCDEPPAPYCDGGVLIAHAAEGTCHDGACHYETSRSACPFGCEAGACLPDPTPDCELACDDPPSAICADADHVRHYASIGRCEAGRCVYAAFDTACALGCEAGACTETACAGVLCNSPPAPRCEGADLLRHSSAGQCAAGECHYVPETIACPFGCEAGACLADPTPQCATTCDDPPATTCADADHVRSYSRAGRCDAGQCVYEATDTSCAQGCEAGRCLDDPCLGQRCETPPASSCQDGTLLSYSPVGTCAQGACQYESTQTACPYGCHDAACAGPTGFLITEVYYDSPGADTDCFIEIHGPANTSVEGLSLVAINGANGQVYATIPLTGETTAAGFYLVMQPSAPESWRAKAQLLSNRADLQNGPDSVQLRYGETILDALAYGHFGPSEHPAGFGAPAAAAAPGESLSRDEALTDTRDNAADFHISAPSPGERQPPITCEDHCVENAVSCDGAQGTRRCVRQSSGASAGCLAWSPDRLCGAQEHCEGGACVLSCTDACSENARRCDGTQGAQQCVRQPSGCLGWSATTLCEEDERCESGECVVRCTDTCTQGVHRCEGLWSTQACVRQASGCLDWAAPTQCEHNTHCEAGACIESCTDLCTEGQRRCHGVRGVQVCAVQATGCLGWSDSTSCDATQICEAGHCVEPTPCTDSCAVNAQRCTGPQEQQLCEVQASGCRDWSAPVTCAPNKHCEGGACVLSCTDACEEGQQTCGGPYEVKTCQMQPSGCFDWSAPTACGATERCYWEACRPTSGPSYPFDGNACPGDEIMGLEHLNQDIIITELGRYRLLVEKRLCAAVGDCGPWEPAPFTPDTFGEGDTYIMRRDPDRFELVLRDDAYFSYVPRNPPPGLNHWLGGHFLKVWQGEATTLLPYGVLNASNLSGTNYWIPAKVNMRAGDGFVSVDLGKMTGVVRPHCFQVQSWAESRPETPPYEEFRAGVVAHY